MMLFPIISILVGVCLIVGLAIGVLRLLDRLTLGSRKTSPGDSRRFEERLHQPDFEALEKHFGCSIPVAFKQIYSNHAELDRAEFSVVPVGTHEENSPWFIASYVPADVESLRYRWPGTEAYLAFADDGCGNEYLIDPKDADARVLFHDHETGELSEVCGSLLQFMNWLRADP
jgi:hypothetical protein